MQGEVAHTDLSLSVLRGVFFCITFAQADRLISTVLGACVFGHASHFFFWCMRWIVHAFYRTTHRQLGRRKTLSAAMDARIHAHDARVAWRSGGRMDRPCWAVQKLQVAHRHTRRVPSTHDSKAQPHCDGAHWMLLLTKSRRTMDVWRFPLQ